MTSVRKREKYATTRRSTIAAFFTGFRNARNAPMASVTMREPNPMARKRCMVSSASLPYIRLSEEGSSKKRYANARLMMKSTSRVMRRGRCEVSISHMVNGTEDSGQYRFLPTDFCLLSPVHCSHLHFHL